MVQDPYKVLGISPGADAQTIKKAYREKAKQYHPDLHPDEPEISKKMSEVNEAYEMLMNPEKYESMRRQQSGGEGNHTSGGYYNRGYENYGGFSDFGFDDIFGFGFGGMGGTRGESITITILPEDSENIIAAVKNIADRRYQAAVSILNGIPNTQRNARWFYISAIANNGAGNAIAAAEYIRKAVSMDPENEDYRRVYELLNSAAQNYRNMGSGYGLNISAVNKICCGLCAAQFLCRFCYCGI